MNPLVLVTDYAWPTLDPEQAVLSATEADLVVAGDDVALAELAPKADAILTNWRRIPADVLETAGRCVVVARYGIGVDNIPVETATRLGIVVANVPDFCLDEVADHTIALLLACNRQIVPFANATSRGEWSLEPLGPRLRRLSGQTLGLLGFGRIGRAVASRATTLGLRIIAYSPRLSKGSAGPLVETTNELSSMLRRSDFVSLHAPATVETERIIDAEAFRQMKRTAYLINTSRGALVDENALVAAVEDGAIFGAALDVLASEPPSTGSRLLTLDNVIVTPHAAFYSQESVADVQRRAAENVAAALSGRVPQHIVNEPVLDRPNCRLRTL